MTKYIVFKRVFATEYVLVESDSQQNAIDAVEEGEGVVARNTLEWNGDMPSHLWQAESIEATQEEYDALRRSAAASQDLQDLEECNTVEDMLDEF